MANVHRWSAVCFAALCAVLLTAAGAPACASTLCVNPKGSKGCFSLISAAVAAAAPNDTIQVAHGTYREMVIVGKSLSLIGAGPTHTIIDATGKCTVIGGYNYCNAIYIDGMGKGQALSRQTTPPAKTTNPMSLTCSVSAFVVRPAREPMSCISPPRR